MKRGQIGHFVELIAIAAALVVMLAVIWPVLKEALFEAGEKGECEFSVLISGLAKQGSLGTIEVPPECKMRLITIDKAAIAPFISAASATIQQYKQKGSAAYEWFKEGNEEEWVIDSIIAKELADCSDKVLHGKLDLFKGNVASKKGSCIICSRIKFGTDLPLYKIKTQSGFVGSLNGWLVHNNIQGQSYYEYVQTNPKLVKKDSRAGTVFPYSFSKPYAVIYWEYNPSQYEQLRGYFHRSPNLAAASGVVLGAATIASFFTPLGWVAATASVIGSAPSLFYATTEVESYYSQALIGKDISLGTVTKAIRLVPYDDKLVKPIAEGGIGCEQIIN